MWADPVRSEGNTIVWLADPGLKLTTGDFVRVTGVIGEGFAGENAFGGEIAAATVVADKVAVVSALAAPAPERQRSGEPLLRPVAGAGTPSPRITYYAAPQVRRALCSAGTWSQEGFPPRQ
jgi:hypothetical protein